MICANYNILRMQIESDSSSNNDGEEFKRLYDKQLNKQASELPGQPRKMQKMDPQVKRQQKQRRYSSEDSDSPRRSRSRERRGRNRRNQSESPVEQSNGMNCIRVPEQIRWHIYDRCPPLHLDGRIRSQILQLPIYNKRHEILDSIIKNQFVLITGDTGCGKSTQVPRLLYEYLRQIKDTKSRIMCVQPRRLAVINLQSILNKQILKESGMVGYQVGMKSNINPQNRIVFVTNGIFLQRLVHSTEFFQQYPFILLDEVHERDIDTDFILLTIKRVIRLHPKVRIILMSATIDNELFRYYFASDHIDGILKDENFYKKIIMAQQQKKQNRMLGQQEDEQSQKQADYYKSYGFQFMQSKYPCPTINVTQPGKFKRQYYYLDTLSKFLKGGVSQRWGSIIFSERYPCLNKQLFESVCLIIDEVAKQHKHNEKKCNILMFLPGLGEIQNLSENITSYLKADRIQKQFQIIHVHSTILSEEITNRLHEAQGNKIRLIIATNIAESSITVLGVKYIIDFCLTKEVRFDFKSRMQNLELVWASKASCNQRAGRTGRVCDGIIIRLLQQSFYNKLPDYSTPQIQRSSLDKLVLRIKLLHQGHGNQIFADPGEVLGSAIQPPNLKNIDTAIKSLQFCGGLQLRDGEFFLTQLGRFYIDVPIDITYCKLLVLSRLFGTFEDVIILVSILSQSKNAIRRGNIDRNYVRYFEIMDNPYSCDFQALINLYRTTSRKSRPYSHSDSLSLQTYKEVTQMISDIKKRLGKRNVLFQVNQPRKERLQKLCERLGYKDSVQGLRFQITLLCGFIENILKIREASLDDKQEKRIRLMKREGIQVRNTVCILGSHVLRKPQTEESQEKLKNVWKNYVERAIKINGCKLTITHGLSYLHFEKQKDINKFLFYKYIQENKKSFGEYVPTKSQKNYLTVTEILNCFGETDHMHSGRPVTFTREQGVSIDNYSLNRVTNQNEGEPQKYLLTNNIAKQSSRMVARFTSLLPQNIPHLQILAHLLFYPFLQVIPNKARNRYQAIFLKKSHKIQLKYNLTADQIHDANIIRRKLKNYLSLNKEIQENYDDFLELVLEFVLRPRQEVVDEQRWQETYLKQVYTVSPHLKQHYTKLSQIQPKEQNKNPQRSFMNELQAPELVSSYFSDAAPGSERKSDYDKWKVKKMREINQIQQKAVNHESYLACGEDSCGLKLAKLKKVGPINQQIYRDLFEIQEQNVKQLPFSEMGSHFCTLLMSNYIQSDYKTFACANNHYFGIMLEKEKRIKILPFSQLFVIYPNGFAEKAQFQRLDFKFWRRTHDQKVQQKFKMKLSTYCFLCDELLSSFKQLQLHLVDGRHTKYSNQFRKTLPKVVTVQKANIVAQNDDGY